MSRQLTAKELEDQLTNDPAYQAMMAEKMRVHAERVAIWRKDMEPVVVALSQVGWPESVCQVGDERSVWDLVNTAESYPQLVPVLAEHITKNYLKRTKEAIARSLAVKEAKGTDVPNILMDELKKETDPNEGDNSYRWVLINTLITIGNASLRDDVRSLLKDPRYESVREHLTRLGKKVKCF